MSARDLVAKPASPLYIMLSGIPCSGKSTWGSLFATKLTQLKIPVRILSADDMAFQLCDEHNKQSSTTKKLTYKEVVTTHREHLEQQFKNALLSIRRQPPDVVIIDRTYLSPKWRTNVLALVKSKQVHLVSFNVSDHQAWQEKLDARNQQNPEKTITPGIIASLTKHASPPTLQEGFASLIACTAIGELGWEKTFSQAMEQLLPLINKNHIAITTNREFS